MALPISLPGAGARQDSWLIAGLLAAGACVLAYGLQLSNGALHPIAIRCVGFTLAAMVLSALAPRIPWVEEKLGDRLPLLVGGLGLAVFIWIRITTPPGVYLRNPDWLTLHQYTAVAAILIGAVISRHPWGGKLAVPMLLATHFAMGVWLIKYSPDPFIDVYTFHVEGFRALAQGINPYTITIPNIYRSLEFFNPAYATAETIFSGFPYPPVMLLVSWLGHLVTGEFRYAYLACFTLGGALMAYSRPGPVAYAAAAIYLFMPRGLFVLEQAWTEPVALLLLTAILYCAFHFPKAVPFLFGVLVVSKQYLPVVGPFFLFLIPQPWTFSEVKKFVLRGAAAGLLITLPFVLWGPGAFLRSVVVYHVHQKFRPESLSYMGLFSQNGLPPWPEWVSFAILLPAMVLAWWRLPRTPAGFALAVATVLGFFFATARQSFCNYHTMVVGTLCAALAVINPPVRPVEPPQ
jgi:hypothetical protein